MRQRMGTALGAATLLAAGCAGMSETPALAAGGQQKPNAPPGAVAATLVRRDEPLPLTFVQDGPDLVVSATVTVNNSSHVLWTKALVAGDDVRLYYEVFQNSDLFVRSQKQVEVKWRLVGRKKGDGTYRAEKTFLPSSAELKELLPQLQKLTQEGERRVKGFQR